MLVVGRQEALQTAAAAAEAAGASSSGAADRELPEDLDLITATPEELNKVSWAHAHPASLGGMQVDSLGLLCFCAGVARQQPWPLPGLISMPHLAQVLEEIFKEQAAEQDQRDSEAVSRGAMTYTDLLRSALPGFDLDSPLLDPNCMPQPPQQQPLGLLGAGTDAPFDVQAMVASAMGAQ